MKQAKNVVLTDATERSILRQAFGRFATGVTVITTRTPEGKTEGLTANSFSAVSLDPPLLMWSLQKSARSLSGFKAAGCFAIHVLGAHQHELMQHFAKPAADKFDGLAIRDGYRGCPVLPSCLAVFECSTANEIEAGDHIIFIGRIESVSYDEGEPLIFHAGRCCVQTTLGDVTTRASLAHADSRAGNMLR